ncbi:hypothetical protein Cni_G25350 [Canna indica]|uniref:PUM-HD domain-containing protein n=1 Tax=Canna indica TaxID=4628 RepID=A0AAQ3KWU8_9LILI|nr:hypothetical protein Cni_G25350 [Canna indica]
MLSEMGVRSMIGTGGDACRGDDMEELGMLLREQRRQEAIDRERELNIFRSGSAPPTVEGSLNAVGGLFGQEVAACLPDISDSNVGNGLLSEEELRSNPAYLSYYYSHVNLNPRLPPPVLSKEDWRSTQRLQVGRSVLQGIGDRRRANHWEEEGGISLFSQQPMLNPQEYAVDSRKAPSSGEWLDKGEGGLIGFSHGRQKSFADVVQEDYGHKTPVSNHPSRPQSRNAHANGLEAIGSTDSQLTLNNEVTNLGGQQHGDYAQSANELQSSSISASHNYAAIGGLSLGKSTNPDPQLVGARASSPCLPIGQRFGSNDPKDKENLSATVESDNIIAALSSFNLSTDGGVTHQNISQSDLRSKLDDHQKFLFGTLTNHENFNMHSTDSHSLRTPSLSCSLKSSYPDSPAGGQMEVKRSGSRASDPIESRRSTISSANSYVKQPSSLVAYPGGSPGHYQNLESADSAFAGNGVSAYSINPSFPSMLQNHIGAGNMPPLFEGAAAASAISSLTMDATASGGGIFAPPSLAALTDLQKLNQFGNQSAVAALQTPFNDPLYLQYLKVAEYTTQVAANTSDPLMDSSYMGNSYSDLLGIQNSYMESLLQSQKPYGFSLGKSGSLNHNFYGSPTFGIGLSFPGSPLAGQLDSPIGPGSPLRLGERSMHFPYNMRNFNGGNMASWNFSPSHNMGEHFPSSLLDEFKNNKTRCFELAEIAGHVVEFSADQYGSRFIQQKLETATTEEKNMVFEEIMPHALSLMTDVFGNYVVQKFLEHGSAAQRRELANQLNGHVLALSLQMYGCRVIQKAIEVVDLDQKKKMVLEIDGHVMRCVRDQNGNHVIQKCIECVPPDAIQFIVSTFYDQVVTLSTHPYGCRVIQRVLEYCDDSKTQQIVMGEILHSVCLLAQDQYGNYVIQHVLEHGKPSERSAIIKQLAGQIVQMSLQKFASNVIEKCLTFGSLEERQILVHEMLGSTDENEPLQAMMKDQFANYVVQKVLETCDDQQRELILSRIKVHLNALKKYTYGKHIVARVEKLVAAGERRIGFHSQHASSMA